MENFRFSITVAEIRRPSSNYRRYMKIVVKKQSEKKRERKKEEEKITTVFHILTCI